MSAALLRTSGKPLYSPWRRRLLRVAGAAMSALHEPVPGQLDILAELGAPHPRLEGDQQCGAEAHNEPGEHVLLERTEQSW